MKILRYFFKPKVTKVSIKVGNGKSVTESFYGEIIKTAFEYRGTKVEIEIQ